MWSTISISISVKIWSIARSIDHKKKIDRSLVHRSFIRSEKKIEALINLNPQLHPVFHQSWYNNRVVVLSDGHPSKHLYTVLFSLELILWKNFGGTNTTYCCLSLILELGVSVDSTLLFKLTLTKKIF
jgi:hypothetical protein